MYDGRYLRGAVTFSPSIWLYDIFPSSYLDNPFMEMFVMISGQAIWLFEMRRMGTGQSTETEKFRLLLLSPVFMVLLCNAFIPLV